MKNYLLLLLSLFILGCNNNKKVGAGDCDDPFIQHWNNNSVYTLKVVSGTAWSGQDLAPAVGTEIGPNTENDWVLFYQLSVDINSADGTHIGTADVNYSNGVVIDKNGFITFTYNNDKSHYESDCWKTYRYFDLSIASEPSFISNDGWSNGMGNQESSLIAGDDYWGVDYGADKWSISNDAAFQSTKTGQYSDVGSRAFPIHLETASPDYKINGGIGAAMDGLWQIDIKIGSNGGGDFCETFYLAERINMNPGVDNYQDGSGGAPGGIGREIDILETKWQPSGPQINLPTGGGSGWNPNSQYINYLAGKWVDNGGAPATEFSTFGALIRDNNLWIYAYKTDGTIWYSTDAIPLDSDYDQKGDFVPYIGTWGKVGSTDIFETGYKNYIYLAQDDSKIVGKNPKDNPEAFGQALVK